MTAANHMMPERPLFVKAFLWGAKSRPQALAYLWSNVIIAVFGLAIGYLVSAAFVLCALADWAAVRWMDKNGGWGGSQ